MRPAARSTLKLFQSTHSLRSATAGCLHANHPHRGFNPRTPCGVRLFVPIMACPCTMFQSTHSLRSATIPLDSRFTLSHGFNPRTPCGVRRDDPPDNKHYTSFNPRTPCGVRLRPARPSTLRMMFQSTHSLRSATSHMGGLRKRCRFQSTHSLRSATNPHDDAPALSRVSIHALLAECVTSQCFVENLSSIVEKRP